MGFIKKIIVCIGLLSCYATAKPPLEELLSYHFCPVENDSENDLFFLHPLHGACGAEFGLLKNIQLYAPTCHATVQLLKTLFVVEEGNEFLETSYRPYCTFTPETIASFVGALYTHTLFDKDSEENYCSLTHITSTFNGPNSPRRISLLIDLIHDALQEEHDKLYPPTTVYQILLAFLYLKADSCYDFLRYTHHFGIIAPATIHSYIDKSVECKENQLISALLDEYILPCRVPKLLWQRNVPYKSYKPISDCCETALRGFMNELFFDPATKMFSLNRLSQKRYLQISDSVKNFYAHTSQAHHTHDINNKEAHIQWLEVVSNLHGIQYRKENYEVHPSVRNMLYALSLLCGTPIAKNKFLGISCYACALCKKLSTTSFTLSLEGITTETHDTNNDLVFLLRYNNNEYPDAKFILHIRKDHAWISQLKNIQLQSKTKKNSCSKFHLYRLATTTDAEKYTTLKQIESHVQSNYDSDLCAYMLNIFKSITNTYFLKQALLFLINKKLYTELCIKNTIIERYEQLSSRDQQPIMMALVRNKAWYDDDFANRIAHTIINLKSYEIKGDLTIDNKVITLQQLKSYQAQEHLLIKRSMAFIKNQLSEERLQKYHKKNMLIKSSENT